jgi:hypothetical protein
MQQLCGQIQILDEIEVIQGNRIVLSLCLFCFNPFIVRPIQQKHVEHLP